MDAARNGQHVMDKHVGVVCMMSRPGPRGPDNSLEMASSGRFGQEVQAGCGKLAMY